MFEHADGTTITLSFPNTVRTILAPFFRQGKGGWHTRDRTGPRRGHPREQCPPNLPPRYGYESPAGGINARNALTAETTQ